MDRLNFDDRLNSLHSNQTLFKRLLVLMIGANVILSLVLCSTINKEKIILVPQVAPEYKLWISQNQVSNEYLSQLSRNVLDLMLNITPENVTAQHQEILHLVTPKYTASLKDKLSKIAKLITTNNISQNFYISNVKILHSKNTVYIVGTLNEYIDQTLVSTTNKIYKLSFAVNNYGVSLNNFELINDNAPELRDIRL